MKTRSKISKRKSSCKCKSRSQVSLRKYSCSRKNPSTLPKVPTSEFRNLNFDKYYIFHFYGNDSLKGKPVLFDYKRFVVESNGKKNCSLLGRPLKCIWSFQYFTTNNRFSKSTFN